MTINVAKSLVARITIKSLLSIFNNLCMNGNPKL
jgi:hypothetical protein